MCVAEAGPRAGDSWGEVEQQSSKGEYFSIIVSIDRATMKKERGEKRKNQDRQERSREAHTRESAVHEGVDLLMTWTTVELR